MKISTTVTARAKLEYEDRIKRMAIEWALLFDEAQAEKVNPIDKLIAERRNFEAHTPVYGEVLIQELKKRLQSFTYHAKEDFVFGMMDIMNPLVRARFLDFEVQQGIEEFRHARGVEFAKAGMLNIEISKTSKSYSLSDLEVSAGDLTLKIYWTDPDVHFTGPTSIKNSFKAIADILRSRSEIKAVATTNWMMLRIMRRLGFEALPNVPVSNEERRSILAYALAGRQNKTYQKQVGYDDISYGAISRNKFMEKYD